MTGRSAAHRLAAAGRGPGCRPVSQASRSWLYSWPATAKPASRQSPGPAASAYSNVWLQCCQAKLLPSGAVRWSPSIHTPDGQALHERISAMCSVPSGETRLPGVPRFSSATERGASAGSRSTRPGVPAPGQRGDLDHRVGQVGGDRGRRRGQVRAGHDEHRQVAQPA